MNGKISANGELLFQRRSLLCTHTSLRRSVSWKTKRKLRRDNYLDVAGSGLRENKEISVAKLC